MLSRPVVHDLALREQNDVVEKLEGLRRGLQERHEHRALHHVRELAQALHDLERGGTVQPRRDFVHEHGSRGANNHLPCTVTKKLFKTVNTMLQSFGIYD